MMIKCVAARFSKVDGRLVLEVVPRHREPHAPEHAAVDPDGQLQKGQRILAQLQIVQAHGARDEVELEVSAVEADDVGAEQRL